MHDVQRPPRLVPGVVRGVQAAQHRRHEADRVTQRERLILPVQVGQQRRERRAVRVVHHQKQLAIRFDHVQRLHHIRMQHPGTELNLVLEASDQPRIIQPARVHTLDGNESRKIRRPSHQRHVHRPHAALGDLREQRIAADPLADAIAESALTQRRLRQCRARRT